MPKLAPIGPDDLQMHAIYGGDGATRPFGLFHHRTRFDISTFATQSVEDYLVFEPAVSLRPFMIVFAAFVWDLADTNFDNTEISMGGNAGVSDLLQGNPISVASNNDPYGYDYSHPQQDGGGGLLLRDQGSTSTPHWEKVLSGYAGGDTTIATRVFMRVDSTTASAMDYTGTITAHILWASLRSGLVAV